MSKDKRAGVFYFRFIWIPIVNSLMLQIFISLFRYSTIFQPGHVIGSESLWKLITNIFFMHKFGFFFSSVRLLIEIFRILVEEKLNYKVEVMKPELELKEDSPSLRGACDWDSCGDQDNDTCCDTPGQGWDDHDMTALKHFLILLISSKPAIDIRHMVDQPPSPMVRKIHNRVAADEST